MADFRRLSATAVMLLSVGLMLPISAHAVDLTGAWATESDLCGLVFAKKGNQIVFSELSDLYGSGFIFEGDRIRGKSARCTIKSRKIEGDTLNLFAACSTSIMNSNVQFSLKVIDENKITRLFPDMQQMTLTYSRCAP